MFIANCYIIIDDIKLKEVRNLVWDVCSKWEDLGIELDLSPDSLEVGVHVLVHVGVKDLWNSVTQLFLTLTYTGHKTYGVIRSLSRRHILKMLAAVSEGCSLSGSNASPLPPLGRRWQMPSDLRLLVVMTLLAKSRPKLKKRKNDRNTFTLHIPYFTVASC